MKVNANKIHVILGLAILTQVGCNANQQQRGQYLNPNIAGMQAQDLTTTGDAFRRSEQPGWGNAANNLGNFLSGNPSGIFGGNPGAGQQGAGNGGGTVDPKGKDATTGTTTASDQAKSRSQKVSWDEVDDWRNFCNDLDINTESPDDDDKDGITNECESLLSNRELLKTKIQDKISTDKANGVDVSKIKLSDEVTKYYMPGLNKDVFNGALISTKVLYVEKQKWYKSDCKKTPSKWDETLCLIDNATMADATGKQVTVNENEAWDRYKKLGSFGDDTDTKFDKQMIRKFGAHVNVGGGDLAGIRDLFKIDQKEFKEGTKETNPSFYTSDDQMDPNEDFVAISGLTTLAKAKYAVARGGREAIPFSLLDAGNSVASLTGMAASTETFRKDSGFIYAAETNLVLPSTGIDLHIGKLMKEQDGSMGVSVGNSAGIFMLIAGRSTKIVSTHMITKKGEEFGGQKAKYLKNSPSCQSVHIVMVYLADEKTVQDMTDRQIFSENVFYRADESDTWKPIPQQMMSLNPRGEKCKVNDEAILFADAATELKRAVK